MNSKSFKPEVFFTLPICGLVIALVLASLITEQWVVGRAESADSTVTFNFGLFAGKKATQIGTGTLAYDLGSKSYATTYFI